MVILKTGRDVKAKSDYFPALLLQQLSPNSAFVMASYNSRLKHVRADFGYTLFSALR